MGYRVLAYKFQVKNTQFAVIVSNKDDICEKWKYHREGSEIDNEISLWFCKSSGKKLVITELARREKSKPL